MIHNLKILPEYFTAVACGAKTFEVRKDDRPFNVGDILELQEYDGEIYTGRTLDVIATYILRDTCYCKEGFCIIGIRIIKEDKMVEYIEKEAVVRYLKEYSEKELNSMSPYGMIISKVLDKAGRALSEMPATDVQPVRYGEWEDCSNGSMCSCCCHDVTYETSFCPYCGADMRGKNNEYLCGIL